VRFERRKVIVAVAIAATLSAGAAGAIGEVADYGKIVHAFGRADGGRLALCLIGEAAAYAGYLMAYRTVAAVAGGPVLRYRDALRVVTLGFGAYLVGSAAGSLGIDFYAMKKAGATTREAARRSLALNTLDASGLMGFAAIASVVLLAHGSSGTVQAMAIAWASAVPVFVVAAAFVTAGERAQRIVDVPAGLGGIRGKLRAGFAETIGGVFLVRQVVTHPVRYLGGVIGYPLFWLGDFFILWMALYAFGISLRPADLVVAEATAWVLTLLPLPAGGSGAAEAAMTFTLHAVGVPLSQALSAAIVYRVVSFWLPVVPALLLVPQVRSLQRDLEQSERAEPDPEEVVLPR
jgi:uncharacterized protein (TIRG00374 family)